MQPKAVPSREHVQVLQSTFVLVPGSQICLFPDSFGRPLIPSKYKIDSKCIFRSEIANDSQSICNSANFFQNL